MSDDQTVVPVVLRCLRLPARLTYEQAGIRLGFTASEVTALVRFGHLKPLGKPPQSGHKYLAAVDVEECATNRQWLEKASRALYAYHRERNEKYLSGRNGEGDA